MKNKKSAKNKLLLTVIIVLVLVASAFAVKSFFSKDSSSDNTSGGNNVNYDPPTEEEQKAGDERKEEIIEEEERQQTEPSDTARVIITDAGQYDDIIEVRSFIPDHYQDGTCTITFSQGSQKVSKDTPAYRDASTTICTNPLFERSDFPASGTWKVVVKYTSKDASGTSDPEDIIIK